MSQHWLGDAFGPGLLKRLLLVEGDPEKRRDLQLLLIEQGCRVAISESVVSALRELAEQRYDGVFCAAAAVPELLGGLRARAAGSGRGSDHLAGPTVIKTAHGDPIAGEPLIIAVTNDPQAGIEALEHGAFDCLITPIAPVTLAITLHRANRYERLRRQSSRASASRRSSAGKWGPGASPTLVSDIASISGQPAGASPSTWAPGAAGPSAGRSPGAHWAVAAGMVGASKAMQAVFQTIEKIAQHKASVLIHGESGTGKELVARAIHDLGPRRDKRFVAINCGAIPANLLESELFGHRRGAFTDAVRDKPGLFEAADGGTLFLDEIGELPVNLQVKLLRAIQEEEIRRIGDNATLKIDVRIIAATLRDLSSDVANGRFREDLFYRLNVVPVTLPPLRERREDIRSLVQHFIARYTDKHGCSVRGLTPEAMAMLEGYAWPGNVRELENTIERAMVLCDGPLIEPHLLEDKLRARLPVVEQTASTSDLSIKKAIRAIEEKLIRKALETTGGNRTNASKLLEISHRALLYKIKEYGI